MTKTNYFSEEYWTTVTSFGLPQHVCEHARKSPTLGRKNDEGSRCISYEERLRELGIFTLEKRRHRRHLCV